MTSTSNIDGCLVVGCGSIGLRHASILTEMGREVRTVSRRTDLAYVNYTELEQALTEYRPGYVIISNKTAEHIGVCADLVRLGFSGRILVEKPLGMKAAEIATVAPHQAYVAYNLRFHPIITRIRELLGDREIFAAQFFVGQYLPDWRPGTDYRKSYSASSEQGGGVLRDLSHELDLALWLFGGWRSVAAVTGKFSRLEISSEDNVDIMMRAGRCRSVSVHLDYSNLFARRVITVQADGLSIEADLVKGVLRTQNGAETFTVDRNCTYKGQLVDFTAGDESVICSWREGVEVVRLIEAVFKASGNGTWEENT